MRFTVGLDEVGRGSLAGPVAVAAACIPGGLKFKEKKFGKIKDSKKLSPKQREFWFKYLRNHPGVSYATAYVYPRVIEKLNISRAANTAALRAFKRLAVNNDINEGNAEVFLDGGLFLGKKSDQPKFVRTIIKGDEKIIAIMAASVIAKVLRDKVMNRLSKKYPEYGFGAHKGYGTKKHLFALKKYGPSKTHRMTFDPMARNVRQDES